MNTLPSSNTLMNLEIRICFNHLQKNKNNNNKQTKTNQNKTLKDLNEK